uniref:Uncharacterized protein n=1 Tax=Ralstonia solanacearum TaxID=305 RepID=A0A0S4V5P5_RALSL|nr:protein of unknown function [Ralstonia solanacearum]
MICCFGLKTSQWVFMGETPDKRHDHFVRTSMS